MSNGCVSPDGRLSERAIELLKLLKEKGRLKDTEVAEYARRPLFQVRSSLRELTNAGFLKVEGEHYLLTERLKKPSQKLNLFLILKGAFMPPFFIIMEKRIISQK
jgi:predicted transcriptional regulator